MSVLPPSPFPSLASFIFSGSRDAILLVRPDGRILDANASATTLYGCSAEDLRTMSIADLRSPETLTDIPRQLASAMSADGTLFETVHRRSDGTSFPVEVSSRAVEIRGERYLVSAIRDISLRREAEMALRVSEERYRILLEQAPIAISCHRNGVGVFANAAHRELHRYQNFSEIRGPHDIVAPEAHAFVARIIEDRRAGRPYPTEYETVGRRQDGTTFPEFIKTATIDLPDGPATLVFHLDLSSERFAQEALHRSTELNDTLVRTIPFPFEIVDRSGTILFANDLMRQAVARDIAGQKCWEVYKDDRQQCDHCPLTTGLEHGHTRRIESRGVLGGRIFEIFHTGLEYQGRDAMLEVFVDVTDRHQLEEHYRQSQKIEAVGQLAGGVAHDFNNILSAMVLQVGLGRMTPALPDEVQQTLTEIETLATRASELTRRLLMFSRRSILSVRPVDMNLLVSGLSTMLNRLIPESITLQYRFSRGPAITRADTSMLEQVVVNLVVNARDAMPNGGRIEIETDEVSLAESDLAAHPGRRRGTFVRLAVRDAGCGMPPDVMDRIFEPFFTTKAPGHGTGLGLATVHGIVAQHEGWIEVDSAVGQGTTFRVYFPAHDAPPAEETATVRTTPRGRGETVLFVEDDEAVRVAGARVLGGLGYQVVTAGNGHEALSVWATHQDAVGIVITDVVMPGGISGLELITQLRALRPALKAVLSSGYSADLASAGVPQDAGTIFLPKPYEPHTLAATIRRLLDA